MDNLTISLKDRPDLRDSFEGLKVGDTTTAEVVLVVNTIDDDTATFDIQDLVVKNAVPLEGVGDMEIPPPAPTAVTKMFKGM